MKKNKTIRFLGIPLYKRREKGGVLKKYVLGLPVYKRKTKAGVRKKYIFGICYNKKFLGICYNKKKVSTTIAKASNSIIKKNNFHLASTNLNIAIICTGDMKDILLMSNWFLYLKNKLDNINSYCVLFIQENFISLSKNILKTAQLFDQIYNISIYDDSNFDCAITVKEYPLIIRSKDKRIYSFSPFLLDYVYSLKKFSCTADRFCSSERYNTLFVLYQKILNKNQLQKLDVNNLLEIEKDFLFHPQYMESANLYLSKMGLTNFITVHTDQNTQFGSQYTKLWPVSYYKLLLNKIKDKYPSIEIIQIGTHFEDDIGANINLSGKTTTDEMMILLQNSILHIDFNSYLVTLRKMLTSLPSIVLFGPNDPQLRGYDSDLNIRMDTCPHPCELVVNGWAKNCINQKYNRSCMLSLLPDKVYKQVCQRLEGFNQ